MNQLEISLEEKHVLINALDARMVKCLELSNQFSGTSYCENEVNYYKSELNKALDLRNKVMLL